MGNPDVQMPIQESKEMQPRSLNTESLNTERNHQMVENELKGRAEELLDGCTRIAAEELAKPDDEFSGEVESLSEEVKQLSQSVPVGSEAVQLIDTKLSLKKVLGENWENDAFFQTIDMALNSEGISSLEDGIDVRKGTEQSDQERFVVEANEIFATNGSQYKARLITSPDGEQKVLIAGKIGNDTFYQVSKYVMAYDSPQGARVIAWSPDRFGLVGEEGKVFSLDGALKADQRKGEEHDTLFIEIAGRKYSANMEVSSQYSSDVVTHLPESVEQLGTYLHELGHQLRDRTFKRDPQLKNAASQARNDFAHISNTGSIYNPNAHLTPYETRRIKVNEERGAWALGLSILREAGLHVPLSSSSRESIALITKRAELALSTYDTVPYPVSDHPDIYPIPAFSQAQRSASRRLHSLLDGKVSSYSTFPNFDQDTGESLGNNPQHMLNQLSKTS